jgi:hypothetical protein
MRNDWFSIRAVTAPALAPSAMRTPIGSVAGFEIDAIRRVVVFCELLSLTHCRFTEAFDIVRE